MSCSTHKLCFTQVIYLHIFMKYILLFNISIVKIHKSYFIAMNNSFLTNDVFQFLKLFQSMKHIFFSCEIDCIENQIWDGMT